MLLWLVFEVSVLSICNGLTIIDPTYSQLTEAKQDDHTTRNDDAAVTLSDDASHYRLLHHHMAQSLESIDREELNEQISVLSQKQEKVNEERLEELEEIVKFLQTNVPLSDAEVIHSLLQNIVNSTLHHNVTSSLSELEALRDYLHQIDAAIDFGKMGGLTIMLQLVLDYPFIEVRTSAAWTIGLACQNNPPLMDIAHNISTLQNIIYILKVSSSNHDNDQYPKINLFDMDNIHHLSKLFWTLSALTRQNDDSYRIFKKFEGTDVVYEWLMEVYDFWSANKKHPLLLNDREKNKVIEKILMFASDVVVLNPEQHLFVDQKWCDVFAAHFNYAQQQYQLREITLAYWDIAINKLFCLNCIPFGNSQENITNDHLSVDIGLHKLMTMDIEDEFDLEMKSKATHLMNLIQNTNV
eukprot:570841_1